MPKSLPAVQCGKWTIGSHAQVLDVLLLAPFAETQDKASRRLHYRDWLGPCSQTVSQHFASKAVRVPQILASHDIEESTVSPSDSHIGTGNHHAPGVTSSSA